MPPSTPGARSATGRTRKPLGWLPWVLLLILAVVIALVVLIVVRNNDDNDNTAPQSQPTVVVDQPTAA
jgi:hypothetical protein